MKPNLIDLFAERTAVYPVPDVFRKWGGLFLVSCLMSRRVWTSVLADKKLYPNLFVIFHGDPAVGKSFMAGAIREQLQPFVNTVGMCPNGRCTPQKMVELMAKNQFYDFENDGQWSYVAMFSEIGTFIRTAEISQLQELAELWDCPPTYEAATIGRGEDFLKNPYMTFLACAQPSWMAQVLSQDQMDLGLPSRILFIASNQARDVEMFQKIPEDHFTEIRNRLPEINKLAGFIPWETASMKRYTDWIKAGKPTTDGFPFIAEGSIKHYAARRHLHVAKLAMLYVAARHPERLVIMPSDLDLAWATLFEAEQYVHAIFDGVGGNPYRLRENAILRQITKDTISSTEINDLLAKNFPTIHVNMVLANLIARGALTLVSVIDGVEIYRVKKNDRN